jgi:hypothetical protein
MNQYLGWIAVRIQPRDWEGLIGCSALANVMGCDRKVKIGDGTTFKEERGSDELIEVPQQGIAAGLRAEVR